MQRPTLMERAFELARSGKVRKVEEIRRVLSAEGYELVTSHLAGKATQKTLLALIEDARSPK